jgi:hypothetical protein
LFPNSRKGWHKRKTRNYCLRVFEEYKSLDLESFTGLVESFVGYDENAWSEFQRTKKPSRESQFAQRLVTGLAAERYFESVRPGLSEFKGYTVQNTTSLGCGYDFRLQAEPGTDFLAVEVKGLNGVRGTLSLTPKEHEIATALRDRFFLFVVRNFRDSPFHEIFRNPLSSSLRFRKKERVTVQVSWLANM